MNVLFFHLPPSQDVQPNQGIIQFYFIFVHVKCLNCASWQKSSPRSLHVPSTWLFPFSLFTCGRYGTKYTTGHTMNSCSNSTNKSNMCCWAFGFQVLETQLMFLHFVTAASFSFQLLQCPSGYKNTDIRDVQNY